MPPRPIPIVGARNAGQFGQALAARDLVTPEEVMAALDAASIVLLGFPLDVLRENRGRIFKDTDAELDPRVSFGF